MKSEATERPILFSGEMVRAILEGRKTQTRRVIKLQPMHPWRTPSGWQDGDDVMRCPYGRPGDRLWVRESWQEIEHGRLAAYKASTAEPFISQMTWRPSIFMPRWASRITLEIVNVRVERVQDINDMDALAEGVAQVGSIDRTGLTTGETVNAFCTLWDSINAKQGVGWDANPWVWVIEFTVCENDK